MPSLSPDWRPAFFAAERRLSPRLESLLRSGAVQDAIAVGNGLSRVVTRSIRDAGTSVIEAVGLPSGRQVARMQRAIDSLARALPASSELAGHPGGPHDDGEAAR